MTRGDGDADPDTTPEAAATDAGPASGEDPAADDEDLTTVDATDLAPGAFADLAAEDWRAALAAAGELRPPVVAEIITLHGDRGRRAIEAVDSPKSYRASSAWPKARNAFAGHQKPSGASATWNAMPSPFPARARRPRLSTDAPRMNSKAARAGRRTPRFGSTRVVQSERYQSNSTKGVISA